MRGLTADSLAGGLTLSIVYSLLLECPQGPKKERKKMGQAPSQHFVLESRDIEIVTRREGRWEFSKVGGEVI